MKYRTDFVTNSSSSSFIVAFNTKQDAVEYFDKKMEDTGEELYRRVLNDINEEKPLSAEAAIEVAKTNFHNEAWYILMCKPYKGYRNFAEYMKHTRGITGLCAIGESKEFAEAQEEIVQEKLEEFKKRIENANFLVEVEYCDHSYDEAQLEHEIMPHLDCVAAIFNHH